MESLKIKVDVKRRTTENINLQQGYTYPIELTILDNGKEYDCTGAIPQIHFAKSNGTFNIKTKDITIEGNKVSFILDSEATNRSGTGKLQAVLTRNGFTFGSWAIFCNIFENVIQDGATEDKNVIDVLTELKDEVTKAKPLADSLNANIPKAQPLVNSLNTQIPQATEIAREIESIIKEGGAVDKRELGEYKKDFEGVEHDTLNSRLNRDFDNLHQRMNDSSLLAYEGTSIKADNTYLGLTKDTVIKGKTLQNLCIGEGNFHGYYDDTINMYRANNNKQPLSFNLKPNTTYTRIMYNCEFEGDYIYMFDSVVETDGTYKQYPYYLRGTTCVRTFTTGEKGGKNEYVFNPESGTAGKTGFSVKVGKLVILEGDHTQTPLEELPFIEGIESTGDKSKNLIPSEYSIIDNSYLDRDDVPVDEVQSLVIADYIKVNPNKTYTLSAYGVNSTTLRLYGYDINKQRISTNAKQNVSSISINGCDYIRVSTFKTNIDVLQLEEGIQSTPYQEYYDGYKISGKSVGKNLFNANFSICGLSATIGGDIYKTTANNKRITSDVIRISKNKTYTISCGDGYELVYIIADEKGVVTSTRTTFKSSMTFASENNSFARFTIRKGENEIITENDLTNTSFQLEEATSLTPYEPYQESNYSYILNEPLRSLPNRVCDTIDLETGVLTRRVGKVVLDGSENWVYAEDYKYFRCPTFDYKGKTPLERTGENKHNFIQLCNLFKINTSWSGEQSFRDNIDIDGEFHTISNAGYKLCFRKLECTNVNSFKTWLQANPTTVIYELAEPTTEQLTPQQLKSFDTTTHIISDNKLMPIVSTKIPSDVNAVVQNLKVENKNLEKQLDSAIEELNNADIDLMAIDWETDYRLCGLEWTLLDTMKVETLAESKVVESRILSRYEQAKKLIKNGRYNKSTMEKQLTTYYNRNYLTKEEFNELMQLMNPIGEVETLEELDKVENI